MVQKKHQNPEGGLNEAGRKYFKNKEGSTPFHVACLYGHMNIALMLIDRGANIIRSTGLHSMYPVCDRL